MEKVALVPPKSPCLSLNHGQSFSRSKRLPQKSIGNNSTDDTDISVSSPEQKRNINGQISIIPLGRESSRSNRSDLDDENHYFTATQIIRSRAPIDFRKKVHGIYVLPVSPSLSSSSSSTTTNTDDHVRTGSSTMPIRSRRQLTSSLKRQQYGIKNQCFTDSPRTLNRTLPRSHGNTLRRTPAPSQPPPLPPIENQSNDIQQFSMDNKKVELRICNENIYGMTDNQSTTKKSAPPPVPSRTQKPLVLSIGFEDLRQANEQIGFRSMIDSTTHDDALDHSWPKPPESLTTSQISNCPQMLPTSISYDRLQHDHHTQSVGRCQTQTSMLHCFQLNEQFEHSMVNESDS